MHRNRRTISIFMWPSFAVTVIAGVLLSDPGWLNSAGQPESIIPVHRIVSTHSAPRPRVLDVEPPVSEAIDHFGKTRRPTAHRRRSPQSHAGRVSTVASPREMPAAVSLHAPLLQPLDELAGLDESSSTGEIASVRVAQPVSLFAASELAAAPAMQRTELGAQKNAWPATPALDAMLVQAANIPAAAHWVAGVRERLIQLHELDTLGDPSAGAALEALTVLSAEGLSAAEELNERRWQLVWLRAAHALQRRLAVWQPVWETTARPAHAFATVGSRFAVDTSEVRRRAQAVADLCQATGDAHAWQYYLLLDRVSDSAQPSSAPRRRITAQRLLSRMQWEGLSTPQQQWLQQPEIQDLAAAIRPWAAGPVDYSQLLHQLERQESDAIDLVSIDVAATTQTLRFAAGPAPQQVAQAINTYYRNANLRVAISAAMLNRILPDVPDRSQPVSQNIMGTQIQGNSHITSDVRVKLVPAADRWSLQVLTDGQIHADTIGRNGPVTLNNSSDARFHVRTDLAVTPQGVQLSDSEASVDQQTHLRGMRSEYDGFPLIGSLVRGIAMSKYQDARQRSQQITVGRMEQQLASSVHEELEQQIGAKTEQLTDQLLGPLAGLRLAPTVIDLQTDESRLTARYRLAGDWQLAAFTPRPRAMSDSLLSVQIHQSAVNNLFERLVPSEEPRAISEVARELVEMFGQDPAVLPADLPSDVHVQFAKTRPVTTEIEEDRLWLTFRIVRLTREGGLDLRNFIVRASYRGETDGLHARFVREGHLSIKGMRMSMGERVTVRAIFNKILNEDQPLPLTSDRLARHPAMEGTEISQLELRDGWIALAIAPRLKM